jgi:translocation and assembly module TamB
MRRAYLAWLAVGACWLGGSVLGLGAAAFRTDAGRRLVVVFAERMANENLRATLTLGSVGGSFFRGLEVQDVTLVGEDGVLLATVDRIGLRYRLSDLLSGRIVLGQLTLTRPRVNLVQWSDGEQLNADVVLSGSGEGGDGGPGPLIAFNDVVVVDGGVVIRTPERRSNRSVVEGQEGPRGYLRVRRIEGINGMFSYVRMSSPLPGDHPVLLDVERLRAEASDPRLSVASMRGRVEVWGDSLAMDLARARLPETEGSVEGMLRWSTGPLLPDLRIRTDRGRTDDVRGLVRDLAPGLAGSGRFAVRALNREVMEVEGERLDVRGVGGGGRARGRLGVVLGPGDEWALVGTDLRLDDFDVRYTRMIFDTLPVLGRMTGRVVLNGSREDLFLTVDGVFRDSLVEGWPESRFRGEGGVAIGVPGDFVFREFEVEDADLDLASVRRLIPQIELLGRLRGSGTLNGAWLNPTYQGRLRYADAPLPETVVRGIVELDARFDTLGVWGDVDVDSLNLESFRSTYPEFDVIGAFAGRVTLSGWLDSLTVDADLTGPAGILRGTADLHLLTDDRSLRLLDAAFEDVDVHLLQPALPTTLLTGVLESNGGGDPGSGTSRGARLILAPSVVQGTLLDSARAVIALSRDLLRIDTLEVWARGIEIGAEGSFGLESPRRGVLVFAGRSDSIGVIEPTLESVFGPLEVGAPPPRGRIDIAGRIDGSFEGYQVTARLSATTLRRGDMYAGNARGTVSFGSVERTLALEAEADSLEAAGFGFKDVQVQVEGRADSLSWFTRGVFGLYDAGSWLGGGRLVSDSARYEVSVDSLGILLATGPWFVDTAAVVAVDDSGIGLSRVAFDHARDAGYVAVNGRLAFGGPGELTGALDALPVSDVWLLLQRNHEIVGGELSGTFRLAGTGRAPIFRLDGNLADGRFGDFHPPYTRIVAEYRDERLTGDLQLVRRGERMLDIEVELPVNLAIADVAERRLPGEVRVRAVAEEVDLASFEGTIPAARELGGVLHADFGITGTWEDPELTGRVTVRDGTANFPALGVRHEALKGTLDLRGDTIHAEQVALRSGDGVARIEGFVRLEELTRPILDLRIRTETFEAIQVHDFLELTTTADVALRGPFFGATLTGRSQATRGVLYFADLVRKDIVNLEDSLFAQFIDTTLVRRQGLGRAFENRFLDSLLIDSVRVEMGTDVWLRSTEADVQLEGAVYMSHARGRYRFDGTLEAPRGRYRLQLGIGELGAIREFQVTRGQVRYLGTEDLDADLDIDAEHKVDAVRGEDVTVFVNIGGTVYEPRITFTSSAGSALSETEIISYLLVGAPSVQAGTGAQGFESWLLWQQAFGVLSSQLEYALVSDVGVPLDYFQIRPETGLSGGLAGAEVALGKRFQIFGTTAFLKASPRFCQARETAIDIGASLEFRLTQRWLISASRTPLTRCETLAAPLATRYQFGLDVLWESKY